MDTLHTRTLGTYEGKEVVLKSDDKVRRLYHGRVKVLLPSDVEPEALTLETAIEYLRRNRKNRILLCLVWVVLYLLFLFWVKSVWGLLLVPFIVDAYITKYIPWSWWKELKNPTARMVMSWVDAILFALIAVGFVNLFAFQNYVIPSASLEKSLLTGDYLLVSKVSYGPRIPQTPLSMPLTQHTMPILNCKSYIEWPQWAYRRVKGLGQVELNDIVVFNYPSGDTIVANPLYQAADFYGLCYQLGQSICVNAPSLDSLSADQQKRVLAIFQKEGRQYIEEHPEEFGKVMTRPVDRRENYVKRCVGLPGQTLQIKDRVIYLDGVANKEPEDVQYMYLVKTRGPLTEEYCHELGISREDASAHNPEGTAYYLPLTKKARKALEARTDLVVSITMEESTPDRLYPLEVYTGWTRDNYGPLWIPKKGETLQLTTDNLPFYRRPIAVYEGNQLEEKDGKIFINGQETDSYTFQMDYYWMMGDNRHNSADSRYWGFVPEDHIVGKPVVVWLSLDQDRDWFNGKIRWNRFFKWVDNIK